MRICAITLTEDNRAPILGDALRSVQGWVDLFHIVCVRGPAPGCVTVAKNIVNPSRVMPHILPYDPSTVDPNAPPFDLTTGWRNQALEIANESKCDWALILDTDERIHLNGASIHRLLAAQPPEVEFLDVMHESGEYGFVHFFRLPTQVRYFGRPHEQITSTKGAVLPKVRFSELPRTPEQSRVRLEHVLADLKKELAKDPYQFQPTYYLGATLETLGRHEEAIDAFDKAKRLAPSDAMAAWMLVRMASCETHLGWSTSAMVSILHGLEIAPWMAELYCMAGQIAAEAERFTDAIAWCENAILHGKSEKGLNPSRTGLMDPRSLYELPYEILTLVYGQMGEDAAAEKMIKAAEKAKQKRLDFCVRGVA